MTSVLKASSKSAAPGQYLGYGLQDVRLCHHLLKAPAGCTVSLEFVEDTAIHSPDGTLLLEQSKSALSGNPVADSSIELWKSFANWSRLCVEDKIDVQLTNFRLYVCPKKEGELVQLLHAASTEHEVTTILAKIAKRVTPSNKLKGCNPYITEFLVAGASICQQIILNFRVVTDSDPLEPLKEMLRVAVLEDSLDDFCAYAIGSAKNQVAELIRGGVPPMIAAEHFRKQLRAFVRKHGALGLVLPTTSLPAQPSIDATLAAAPIFVQQLLKVGMSKEVVVRAVSDFLRSDADRTFWAADGLIVEESLDELNGGLQAHFEIVRDEAEDMMSMHDAETRGRQIYRRCITLNAQLEGRHVPNYFIPGSFNLLANSARVGWHPQYTDFFKGD